MKTAKQMKSRIEAGCIHPTKGRRRVNLKKQAAFVRGQMLWTRFWKAYQ